MKERPRVTVGALIFNKKGEILLLKSPKWEGKYINPCGHVELMERLEDAVRREVKEETGLNIKNIEFLTYMEFINPKEYYKKDLHFVGIQYICKAIGNKVKINEEASKYMWIDPKLALNLELEESTKKVIEYLLNN